MKCIAQTTLPAAMGTVESKTDVATSEASKRLLFRPIFVGEAKAYARHLQVL